MHLAHVRVSVTVVTGFHLFCLEPWVTAHAKKVECDKCARRPRGNQDDLGRTVPDIERFANEYNKKKKKKFTPALCYGCGEEVTEPLVDCSTCPGKYCQRCVAQGERYSHCWFCPGFCAFSENPTIKSDIVLASVSKNKFWPARIIGAIDGDVEVWFFGTYEKCKLHPAHVKAWDSSNLIPSGNKEKFEKAVEECKWYYEYILSKPASPSRCCLFHMSEVISKMGRAYDQKHRTWEHFWKLASPIW